MKRKNAFTLIELLAIIVILAIIAVITVPIILNIIENSQKGAVKDSAFGYKDGVNKFYVSKLSQDKDYVIPDKIYTIEELKNMGVSVSGQEPGTNSWVKIENNNVTNGCLQFDEYKVDISNGNIGEASKGECEDPNIPTIDTCPGCVYAYYTSSKNYGPDGSIIDKSEYTKDYTKVIEKTGRNYFLGHKLDETGKIIEGYACGIHDNGTPFCIKGILYDDGYNDSDDIYQANKGILNGSALWNGTCERIGNGAGFECMTGDVRADTTTDGSSVKQYVNGSVIGWCKVAAFSSLSMNCTEK